DLKDKQVDVDDKKEEGNTNAGDKKQEGNDIGTDANANKVTKAIDENGKKIGVREAQVPRDYKTEQTEVHRTDATVINNPPKVHKPCCESQDAIDKKNQSMLREIQNWPRHHEWNNRTGQYEAVIPPGFRSKYRKHMDHFLRFLKNRE
ncbi:MAG: hypothetical protein VXW14_05615, partial [Candidatus Thermoplasmatota archaeon]|nr:hypothetical protein [Candidatus Thermoplasmatota archaeon]